MNTRMQDSDAFAWNMEKDPTLRATIVAIAWLEHSPDWDTFEENVDRATRVLPMFRRRVVESRGPLGVPSWVAADRFDLAWHLRRMDSPAPHTDATVIEVARTAVMTAFDHAHPLWEFTLVENLVGGRAALVMKVHHALTDGIGGMQLALELFDVERHPAPRAAVAEPADGDSGFPPPPAPAVLAPQWKRAYGLVNRVVRSVPPAVWHAARHPIGSGTAVFETVRSIGRTMAPVSDTRSPIMTERSVGRHLDLLEVGLDDLKRSGAAEGGSLNDAFMAAVTGGLRRYHEHHAADVGELRVTLPVSIRTADDGPGGNHITLMRFAVLATDVDPRSRIHAMGELCRAARDERSIRFTGAIAGTLNLLPRAVVGSMLKHIDFLASDIPGFAFPVYLAGAQVVRYVAFAPTTGTSVNFALLSYNGTCCIGISSDTAAVADPSLMTDCVRLGFEEVLALAGDHAPVRAPMHEATASV